MYIAVKVNEYKEMNQNLDLMTLECMSGSLQVILYN